MFKTSEIIEIDVCRVVVSVAEGVALRRQQRKAGLQNGRTAEQSSTPEGLHLTTHKS